MKSGILSSVVAISGTVIATKNFRIWSKSMPLPSCLFI